MKLTIKFFAEAREKAGAPSIDENIDLDEIRGLHQLFFVLSKQSSIYQENFLETKDENLVLIQGYKLMVNDAILNENVEGEDVIIKDRDILGFLPPFSGG